jgi:hypothetical protein
MEMPDELRAYLASCYAQAEDQGRNPAWHEDGQGFDYDCLRCAAEGREHRSTFRVEAQFALWSSSDVATGPAG